MLKGGVSGDHRPDGVVVLFGKHIRQGKKIENASLLDITPTILYLFGLPAGKDMDGRVLTDAIDKDCLRYRPVKLISSYDAVTRNNITKPAEAIEADNINPDLMKKLKTLGYLQ